jgi:hypothetical protein
VTLDDADDYALLAYSGSKWCVIGGSHKQGTDTALGVLGTKNPPIDADKAIYRDSTASDALVTSTWTQVKAFLKTYFDTVYAALTHASKHVDGSDDIQNATAAQKGLATAAQITKLDGIEALADVTGSNAPQAHAASHGVGQADTVFPADPNADKYLMWDDDLGQLAWATGGAGDVATDAIWDAKGDLAVGTGANTAARLAVGADGKYLKAASGEATGLIWDTPAGSGDFKADGSVPLTGDIDFAGTQQCHDLQAPAANGEAIRQTAKITEAKLESATDNDSSVLLTTRGDILYRNATIPARLGKGNPYQVLRMGADDPEWANPNLYIPGANTSNIFYSDAGPDSIFTALINSGGSGGLTTTNVPYDGDSGEGFLNTIVWAQMTQTKVILWNTTRGTSRVVTGIDIANNKLTTVASVDAWANDDSLTTQSQTNLTANYFELDVSNYLTANSVGIAFQAQIYNATAGYYAQWHPFEAYAGSKAVSLMAAVANQYFYIMYIIPVISGKITMLIEASGATTFYSRIKYLGRIDMA